MELSTRSHVVSIDPSFVPALVSSTNSAEFFQVAITTLLVYDTLITMDKEIRYFWRSPLKAVNIVYFANRYIGILGSVSFLFWDAYIATLPLCNFSQWTFNVSNWITIISVDYILMIRVLALYSNDKKLALWLKAGLTLEATSKLGFSLYIPLIQDITPGSLAEGVTICGFLNTISPLWGTIDWLIPMVYGLVLMTLAIYKAAEFWRMSAGFRGFNLVKVLVKDQALYFILIVSCCVFNILAYQVAVATYFLSGLLALPGNPALLCVLGSRMLVNLKEAGEQGLNEGTSYRVRTMSDMEFT